MTITAQTSKTGPYNGNGMTTVFSYTFEVQDEAHLVVTLADAAGVETVQVLNTDYTVSGVGNANGGQITMAAAPASTYTLTISRNIPITQEVDLENRRSVAPEVLEDAYDKLTQIAQDLSEQLGRAIKISVTEGGNPTLTLEGDVQPGTFLGFDVAGNLAQLAPASGTFISPNAAIVAVDDFTGDGTTVDFTLGGIPQSPNNLFIFLDGVMQDAANYTVSGTTLTFTTAPPLNTNIEVRRLQAVALTGGTTADLVTYSPAGSGAVTRTVQSRLRDFVSVKDFGAVGDGVTDDTAAIQAAIDAGVGTILFPEGTFASGLLTPANNVSLKGLGRGISILKLKDSSDTQLIFGTSISDFSISGLEIDGNKSNQSQARNLIQFFSSANISVVGNHIHDASQDGVYFTGCDSCLVEGNKINDNDRNGVSCGAAVDTSVNMRIIHNDISGHTGANDIGISLEPSAKSLVFGNLLTNNWDGVNLAGDGVETIDCNENTIQGNTITATSASNRAIVVSGVSRVTDNNLILENKISGNYARGIVGLTTAGNTFSGNIIDGLTGTNSLAFEGVSVDNSVISNNRLADSQLHGMILTSSDNNTIVGNHVLNNSLLAANVRDGIRLDSCSGNTVTGNYSSGANQQFGIREITAATENTFSGNYVGGNATGGYSLVANSGSFVDGKLFTSTTAVTITGTAGTDVDLQTTQVPANVHKAYSGIRAIAAGRKTGSAGNKQIKFFFGASSIIIDPSDNTTNDWRVQVELFFQTQTSQKLTVTSLDGTSVFQDYGTFSIDTSSPATVKFAGSLADGTDAIIGELFCVEYIR